VIFGSNNGSLNFLNGKTGDLVESVQLDGPIRGSPTISGSNEEGQSNLVLTAGSTVIALNIACEISELQQLRDNQLNSGNMFDPDMPTVTRPVALGRFLGMRLWASEHLVDTAYYIWYQGTRIIWNGLL
jgi:hypothetical protein